MKIHRTKKLVLLLLLLCLTVCPACGANRVALSDDAPVTLTDEWPDNAYTTQIPAPPGTVEWVQEGENVFSAALTGVESDDLTAYLDTLQASGFAVAAQGEAAEDGANLLLSDGALGVSLAYDAGQLVLTLTTP